MTKTHTTSSRSRATRTDEMGRTLYRCTKCEAWKHESCFYELANLASICGRVSWCAKCMTARRKERRREIALARILPANGGERRR